MGSRRGAGNIGVEESLPRQDFEKKQWGERRKTRTDTLGAGKKSATCRQGRGGGSLDRPKWTLGRRKGGGGGGRVTKTGKGRNQIGEVRYSRKEYVPFLLKDAM